MLLNEQEIMDINQNAEFNSAIGYARAIESAVLEKLKAQSDIGFVVDNATCVTTTIRRNDDVGMLAYGTRLYAHPLPPDDVVQKYEELLYAVQRKFPDETRHQTALRYIKTAEAPSYTNAAMKEMKPPFKCVFCGAPSWIEPADQTPPPDYCYESDHGDPSLYQGESK